MLTGDNNLRKTAEKNGLTVKGILYIFDELLAQDIISKQIAHDKLTLLMTINTRLPQTEGKARLELWKQ